MSDGSGWSQPRGGESASFLCAGWIFSREHSRNSFHLLPSWFLLPRLCWHLRERGSDRPSRPNQPGIKWWKRERRRRCSPARKTHLGGRCADNQVGSREGFCGNDNTFWSPLKRTKSIFYPFNPTGDEQRLASNTGLLAERGAPALDVWKHFPAPNTPFLPGDSTQTLLPQWTQQSKRAQLIFFFFGRIWSSRSSLDLPHTTWWCLSSS